MKSKKNVWKEVLEKRVSASKLTRAKTVPKNKEKDFEYQIFEVMIAEALNLCDHNASWQVTQGGNDGGVDLIGTEKRQYIDPLTNNILYKKILGQVKRHARGYPYELFCTDLVKVQKYCVNTEFYNNNALLYFMLILSTDAQNGVHNLRSRVEREINNRQDSVFISSRPGQIQICDAAELMRIWKLNYQYFEYILSEALTEEQMQLLSEFIDDIDFSWLSVSVGQESIHYVGEAFEQIVAISTDMEHVDVDMLIKWYPASNNQLQLLRPLQAIDPRQGGFPLRVHKRAAFRLVFRGQSVGECDCGVLEFSSVGKKLIVRHPLGKVKLEPGFYPDYFSRPNNNVLQSLEAELVREDAELTAYAITGCGGIGKSTTISEAMIHAASRGYSCIEISQIKDYLNSRLLLRSLFRELVNLNEFEVCYDQSIVDDVRNYLHIRYQEHWTKDITVFFTLDNEDISVRTLAECLASVLAEASAEHPLFIWLSDMHWSSNETLDVLRQAILILINNKAALYNKILFVFEGRKGEALITASSLSIPYDWYKFLENDYLVELSLSVWSEEESRELLQKLIVHRANEMEVYAQLYDALLQHSKGVPMHLLEHIRFLLNTGKLSLDADQRLVILSNDFSQCFSEEILQTIHGRIMYFKNKYPEFIEIITVFAILNDDMPHQLFILLLDQLYGIYPNLRVIIGECDFIKISKDRFSFLHEYYLLAFQENTLSNKCLISFCLDHFQGALTEQASLKLIKLKQAKRDIQNHEIALDIIELLNWAESPMLRYELYSMLLQLDGIVQTTMPKYKIYFELCEIMIKIGSWEKAAHHLSQLLNDSGDSSLALKYYQTLAYQELANIQCDRMEFDESIQSALDGIELVELCLRNGNLSTELRNDFLTSYEKLLARIAVCYWFSGNHDRCRKYQQKCLDSAQNNGNAYSIAHVKYEIATFKLHEDLEYGINLMQDILDNINDIPELAKNERGLIHVQQLIGKLIKAVGLSNRELLQDVRLETRRLYDLYLAGYNRIYEEFLCYTIRAICLMAEGKHEQALRWFFESLRSATTGNMLNLTWKANLNLAQYYYIEGDQAVARVYARQTLNILKQAALHNPQTRTYFCAMIQPIVQKLEELLGIAVTDFQIEEPLVIPLLSVNIGNSEFVIMN